MKGEIKEGFPIAKCAEAWTKHRRYTRLTWGLLFGWIPYGVLAFSISELLHIRGLVILAIVPYVLALIIVSNLASRFRCPRCGSFFYAWGPFGGPQWFRKEISQLWAPEVAM